VWECVGLIGFFAVITALVWLLDPNLRRIRAYEASLAAREPLPDEEMLRRHFAPGEVAPDVPGAGRRIFARHMDYPADKLLPDDALTPFWADLDLADLVGELEAEFGVTFTDADLEQTPCVIRAVSLLIEARRGMGAGLTG
jgi:hypothetical protein